MRLYAASRANARNRVFALFFSAKPERALIETANRLKRIFFAPVANFLKLRTDRPHVARRAAYEHRNDLQYSTSFHERRTRNPYRRIFQGMSVTLPVVLQPGIATPGSRAACFQRSMRPVRPVHECMSAPCRLHAAGRDAPP